MDLKHLQALDPWDWPTEAGDLIYQTLSNEKADPAQRLIAAELAGNHVVVNDDLAKTLIAIADHDDESAQLRAEAIIALRPCLEFADMMGFDDPEDILISEPCFQDIQKKLHKLYLNVDFSQTLRRLVLETAVHAPQSWHWMAIDCAYKHRDPAWRLTAVFCMQFIKGFDSQILESLNSENPQIHYHAICAAADWELDAAWDHVQELVRSASTDKIMLLAAIDAVAAIRPQEAPTVLKHLVASEDEDVSVAIYEALSAAEISLEWGQEDDFTD